MKHKTPESVINAFGGMDAFCERFGFKPGQVSTWKWRGKFSDRANVMIFAAAHELDIDIDPVLLGLEAAE